ncbi:MAG: hypothetical protein DMG10_22225 [Acidobacteria bacterium]|nr:MAG: hypothetical protein DMG10_22225 [Acidobacteriota bacterium]PYV41588.1 MAG: hypothetical protein DMG09_04380 [Acidobacteriota bacterium]
MNSGLAEAISITSHASGNSTAQKWNRNTLFERPERRRAKGRRGGGAEGQREVSSGPLLPLLVKPSGTTRFAYPALGPHVVRFGVAASDPCLNQKM